MSKMLCSILLLVIYLLFQIPQGHLKAQSFGYEVLKSKRIAAQSFPFSITHPYLKSFYSSSKDTSTILIPFNPSIFPLYSDSVKDVAITNISSFRDYNNQTQFSRIQQSGSISRGLIVGNTQDASIESGMDLRFEAFLGDSIRVNASLTDQNTPIQPDGSSLQLREFDRVLIQLQSTQTNASLGDIDLTLAKHPYLQLNRRVMGAQAKWSNSSTKLANGRSMRVQGGLAALRGQYQVALIPAVEGFQGPYRLTNDQGEPFVIVLAGSESVFLNGKKLERGTDRDYTVDYSFGEINFTPNRLIRASDRIRIEYQFLNQSYPEVLVATNFEYELNQKWKISYQLARSQAVLSSASSGLLTDAERVLLNNAGDDLSQLRTERVQIADEGPSSQIRYTRVDTVINGQIIQFYRFNAEGTFNVFFSRVSFGEGAYIRAVNQPINGIVYEFVGEGNGDFSPFRQIQAPTAKTVQSALIQWNPLKSIELNSSFALSNFDKNRLSNIDDFDNNQLATFQEFKWKYSSLASVEAVFQQSSSSFETFDRIRDPEFERNWGGLLDNSFGEKLMGVKWFQNTENGSSIEASFTQLNVSEEQKGRIEFEGNWSEKWLNGQSTFRYLAQQTDGANENWLFLNADLKIGNLTAGKWQISPLLLVSHEDRSSNFGNRTILNAVNNNLRGPGYYLEYGSGLELNSDITQWKITFAKRQEDVDAAFNSESLRRNANLYGLSHSTRQKYFKSEQKLSWFDIPSEPSFSLYSQQLGTLADDMGSIRLAYEGESRLQGVLTEVYTFVGNQFGVYYWDDLNQDGVEQLDEFFPERSPEEGTHILQVLPSEELAGITKVQASVRTSFSLNAIFNKSDADKGLGVDLDWSQMDENTTTQVGQLLRLNQDLLLSDSLTLSGRQQAGFQGYWKGNRILREVRLSVSETKSLRNRNTFKEESSNERYKIESQLRATKKIRLNQSIGFEKRRNESTTLLNRRLNLSLFSMNSEIIQAVSSRFRRSLFFEYKQGSGGIGTNFRSFNLKSGINTVIKGGRLNMELGVNRTNLSGEFSPLANFELTGGQGVGTQFRADFRFSRSLGKGLKADVNWSLRTRANEQILQTARFTLNSSF